ncbi:MAG: polyamine aminopropyltransferase [Alphaproteobacteria bacterium]|nr:polyamine aminopropyltransferase [Alphaproteobacteria bacterium]MCD8570467.1 polyamine aminopropyltransferase [Alphaproteobacteria bacterium]
MNPTHSAVFHENAHSIYPLPGSKAFQGFEVNEKLFEAQTPFQHISIYSNDALGKILVLDGAVQITTRDEFIYQEMMAHVPLFSHSEPENVLIIGGGDGGILREVLRHKSLKKVMMVEIDQVVIDACVKHMPEINDGGTIYKDPRTELIVRDAAEYIRETDARFDVVIIDSTDPIGPGEKLFTTEFYAALARTLKPEAYVITQGGVPFFQPGEAAVTLSALQEAGLNTHACITAVPTYYGGYMTLGFATNTQNGSVPAREILHKRFDAAGIQTRQYSPEIHMAAFVLPPWIEADITSSQQPTITTKERAAS